MIFLTEMPGCIFEDDSCEDIIQLAARILEVAYAGSVSDPEAYLATDFIEPESVIFGKEKPDELIKAARNWNLSIQTNLLSALERFILPFGNPNNCQPEDIPLDNNTTYALKCAAMAADDDFYEFADKALYIPLAENGALYFRTILRQDELARIEAVPENYLIIEIPAK